jgi:hypothetical protein
MRDLQASATLMTSLRAAQGSRTTREMQSGRRVELRMGSLAQTGQQQCHVTPAQSLIRVKVAQLVRRLVRAVLQTPETEASNKLQSQLHGTEALRT